MGDGSKSNATANMAWNHVSTALVTARPRPPLLIRRALTRKQAWSAREAAVVARAALEQIAASRTSRIRPAIAAADTTSSSKVTIVSRT